MIDKAAQVDLDQRVVSQKGLTKGSAIFQNKLLNLLQRASEYA